MTAIQITRPPTSDSPFVTPAVAEPTFERCDDCEAPVERQQRYCVSCGAHRRHVDDPAARYLAQTSARKRRTESARGKTAARRRGSGLLTALVLIAIPIAVAVGVLVGRSSTDGNAALIRALRSEKPQVISTTGAPVTAAASRARRHTGRGGAHSHKAGKHTGAGKVLSKTKYGSATQISGFHVTKQAEQQGAAVAQKVQKATGNNYVDQQSSLPTQVVVPK